MKRVFVATQRVKWTPNVSFGNSTGTFRRRHGRIEIHHRPLRVSSFLPLLRTTLSHLHHSDLLNAKLSYNRPAFRLLFVLCDWINRTFKGRTHRLHAPRLHFQTLAFGKLAATPTVSRRNHPPQNARTPQNHKRPILCRPFDSVRYDDAAAEVR